MRRPLGASRGLTDAMYLTVGTGIGGGAIVGGQLVHGMLHPEMGHIRIPHDWAADPYRGSCPYHGDCLEGLACGRALEERWGRRSEHLEPAHPAWALEAHYLALGLATWVCTLSPQKIIIGGGVLRHPDLLAIVREKLSSLLNGYIRTRNSSANCTKFVNAACTRRRRGRARGHCFGSTLSDGTLHKAAIDPSGRR